MWFGVERKREKKELGKKKGKEEGKQEARKAGGEGWTSSWIYEPGVQGKVQAEMYIWEPSACERHMKSQVGEVPKGVRGG